MPPVITFRPITAQDEPFLISVYASTRAEELAPVPWTPEQKLAFVTQQFRAQHAHYQQHFPDARFEVLLVDGQPAGRLYVRRTVEAISIVDITLLPPHRGGGLGTRLLRELLDEGARSGKPVRIHVEHFNRALRLYERLGFRRAHGFRSWHVPARRSLRRATPRR